MAYRQLRAPNLATTDLPGWCLRLVLHAYGFNYGADFARQEWDRNATKRTDSLPTDVAVPVFYSWTGTIDGIPRDWGDVAIYVPGKGVFGTPMRGSGNSNRWDTSVEARRAWLGGGAKYLGWTEQLNGVKLIEQINTPAQGVVMNNEAGVEMYRTVLHREPENSTGPNQWNGQSPAQALRNIRAAEWQILDQKLKNYGALSQQVSDLSSQVTALKANPTKAQMQAVVDQVNALTQQHNDDQTKIAELEKKSGNGISAEDSAAIKETNSLVKAIKALLDKIFK